jgi:PIN domain nuclease of toxin-antitoxin system
VAQEWLATQTKEGEVSDTQKLPEASRETLVAAQRSGFLFLSAISVLEVARLIAYGKLYLPVSIDEFVEQATYRTRLQLLPLTTRILIESTRLPGEIHRDPSDRLLVATAREHGLTLVTRDKDLLAYGRKGHLSVLKL